MKRPSQQSRIVELHQAGMPPKDIMFFVKCTRKRVNDVLFRWRHPDRRRVQNSDKSIRKANAAVRQITVTAVLAQGHSYSQAGKKLELTRGQIAGLKHRAKLAELAGEVRS